MSSRVRMRRIPRRGEESEKKRLEDERIHVNLSIRRQVWTLAREKFANVSRTVEQLLEVALGLKPSFEVVRIGGSGGPVAQFGMSAALARQRPRVQIPAGPPQLFGRARGLDWL